MKFLFLTSLLIFSPVVVYCKPVDTYSETLYPLGHTHKHRDTRTEVNNNIQSEAEFASIALPTTEDPEMGEPLSFDSLPAGVNLTETTSDRANHEWMLCDTTKDSPLLHDIDGVVARLRERGGVCVNTNLVGSHCTRLIRTVDATGNPLASVSLCGHKTFLPCKQVADWVVDIKSKCAWDKYTSGRWHFADNGNVVLHKN